MLKLQQHLKDWTSLPQIIVKTENTDKSSIMERKSQI